ncbi:anion transporter [Parvibaculum lavamentivorans DS-1]|uniref:Anion transporter n=1 Tax=Parvibaculum lavamentivorans (strain DS-1 / DSM 13023 / NCIMB 13966) TaxID=402881 RepID=A7HY68_PARL1|nr:anion transporter [Parvibaculum lavamentivorans DS-1]
MESVEGHKVGFGRRQIVGWLLGPALLLTTFVVPAPEGLSQLGWHTAGVAALMAVWWISEPIPIPATSLLPMILFPLMGIVDIRAAAAPYAHPIIYLFFGGFLLALAMERWNLHRRIALGLIAFMGTKPTHIVAGFMVAAAFLSMWVSNTATALMMLPIALSVIGLVDAQAREEKAKAAAAVFSMVLLLAVAYSATIGGLGTLIGTPPNALLAAFLSQTYGFHIGFGQWMLVGVPVVIVGVPLAWFLLTRVIFKLSSLDLPGAAGIIASERAKIGSITRPEIAVAIIFSLTALGWVTQPLIAQVLPFVSDTGIALLGGLLLFLTPVDARKGVFLMDWQTAKRAPWDVFLLFGGGLSLAAGIEAHGVAAYLGTLFDGAGGMPTLLLVALICGMILMLTELTSNTATAATFLPVIAAVAIFIGQNPLLLLVPAAMAANCSFMMPVGTPPNAIVFGSGRITLPQMAKAGWWLNVAFVLLIVGMVYVIGPLVFEIEPGVLPDWARSPAGAS